jgi:ribulose-phosphate 3-epimerase
MDIIPTINCTDFKCVKRELEIAKEFGTGWIQIDVSDGIFSDFKTWNNPDELRENINLNNLNYFIEVHLMVEKPMDHLENWLSLGIGRVIIHIESDFELGKVLKMCQRYGVELMLGVSPETPIDEVVSYLGDVKSVQILGVNPGPSGQGFQKETYSRINYLLDKVPGVIIEVDGGIDDEIAKELSIRGIDSIAVGSFIFNSANPEKRYKILKRKIKNKF